MRLLTLYLLLLPACLFAQEPRVRIVEGGLINDLIGRETFSLTELSPTVYVDEVGGDVRNQLDRVDQFSREGQWREAVDTLLRITESDESRLAAIRDDKDVGYRTYLPLGKVANLKLNATLSATESDQAIEYYRERIDPLARQWFEEADSANYPSSMRRMLTQCVSKSLHSSYGDDALLALGELALESGKPDTARRYFSSIHGELQWQRTKSQLPPWQRVVRGEIVSSVERSLDAATTVTSATVGSNIPLADVWSRLVLASILNGDSRRAAAELSILKKRWPDAIGSIGGREQNYVEALSELMNVNRTLPTKTGDGSWRTFAGVPERSSVRRTSIDIPMEPSWRIPLLPAKPSPISPRTQNLPTEKAGEEPGALCSFFPVVVGDLVLVYDENRIRCLDLNTGDAIWSDHGDGEFFSNRPTTKANVRFLPFEQRRRGVRLSEQRFTLSATDTTLVATLSANNSPGGSGLPAIVGFDLQQEGIIQFGPAELLGGHWSFQGAPIIHRDRCWVGLRHNDATAQDHVACFDTRTGRELWRTRTSSADTPSRNLNRDFTNSLTTKHEDTIYFSSNLGSVAALSADDGSVRWITTYPRVGPSRRNLLDEPWYALRDLTPCIYHAGLLIVAPADSDRIFALHANSGELVWELDRAEDATQLLGVANGKLLLGGRRLWWIDVWTGKLASGMAANPFPSGELSAPNGFGRGILTTDAVYWPTRGRDGSQIHVMSNADGKPKRQPIDLTARHTTAGNLILSETHLLIAGPRELVAFRVPTERLSRVDEDDGRQNP